jgi:hypothetical protein
MEMVDAIAHAMHIVAKKSLQQEISRNSILFSGFEVSSPIHFPWIIKERFHRPHAFRYVGDVE